MNALGWDAGVMSKLGANVEWQEAHRLCREHAARVAAAAGMDWFCDGETYYLWGGKVGTERLVAAVDGGEIGWMLAIKDQQGTLNLA